MKSVLISSILIRIVFYCAFIFQLYIKKDLMDDTEKYIDVVMMIFGIISFFFPLSIWMYIIQIAHSGYLIYTAAQIKHNEMSKIKEGEAKDLFVVFFVFFSALFQEGQFHSDLFFKIIQQFQFFFLNLINIILVVLSLFLACVYDAIIKGKIDIDNNLKQTDAIPKDKTKEGDKTNKEKVD